MPQQFVACEDDKVLVKCCLNAAGKAGKCGACPQCTHMIGTRRCKNTSCADSRLCHVHYKKLYGVKLMDTKYGKGLQATRNFSQNDLICPMGGRRVKAGHWTTKLPDDLTSPYSYRLNDVYKSYTLELRDEPSVDGYVSLKDAGGLPAQPRYTPVNTKQERDSFLDMRRAYMDGDDMYLVSEQDYDAFIADAVDALSKTKPAKGRKRIPKPQLNDILRQDVGEVDLSKVMKPSQFAVRMTVNLHDQPQTYDASCLRGVGSYGNDGRDATGKTSGRRNNAIVSPVSPYPLRQEAWLVATADIPGGDPQKSAAEKEILVDYGEEYWQEGHVPHTIKVVKKSPGFGGIRDVKQSAKGQQWLPERDVKCPIKS